jgi:hypothetical protein
MELSVGLMLILLGVLNLTGIMRWIWRVAFLDGWVSIKSSGHWPPESFLGLRSRHLSPCLCSRPSVFLTGQFYIAWYLGLA